MNLKSTLIASALVSTLFAAGCGNEPASPGFLGGNAPQQAAANDEEALVAASRASIDTPRDAGSGKAHTHPRGHCRMASDAVEQWLTNGVVPRCQFVVAGRQGRGGDGRTP